MMNMKNLTVMTVTFLIVGAIVSGGAARAAGPVKGANRHAFLLADGARKVVAIFSAEGKLLWEYPAGNTYDAWLLPNGNVLFSTGRGAKEVTLAKKVVWEYKTSGETFAAQRLADGMTLIGEATAGRLVEVDARGKVAREIKLTFKRGGHMCMRMARKTAAGTYLVCHTGDRVVREYDATGKVIGEIKPPGMAYEALRLANGNTLVSHQTGATEYDAAGKAVWTVTAKDLPEMSFKWINTISRLDNGNTVLGNWLGHRQEGKGRQIFEITPDKKVVWQFEDHKAVGHVCAVRILDKVPAIPASAPAAAKTFELAVKDKAVSLTINRVYVPGDVIRLTGPKHMMVRLDAALPEALVYSPTGVIEYVVPRGGRGGQRGPLPREAFAGAKHAVAARPATGEEIAAGRNLSLNPYCMRGQHKNPAFPIATASSEYRNNPNWAARNTIDGFTRTQKGRHGGWPFQSWGPDRRRDLWLKIDFGRPVSVDRLDLHIRADFPHDRHWHSAVIEFPDGSTEAITIKKVAGKQSFAFKKRTVTQIRLTRLVQAEPLGWCAWVEVEFWGTEARNKP